jgi:hypothetical protein
MEERTLSLADFPISCAVVIVFAYCAIPRAAAA